MTWRTAITTLAATAAMSVHAGAGQEAPRDIELTPERPPQGPASRSSVSLERIQKKLAQLPPSAAQDRLKLEYYIEVYGKAPQIDFFENFNVTAGPVPRSAPTHQDILDVVTPEGFRTPAPNLSALIDWLRQQAAK